MPAAATLRLALFGHPVAHSRSPALHAAFGRQFGIEVDYSLFDVAPRTDGGNGLAAPLAAFIAAGGRGANVTVPLKLDAAALCRRDRATLGASARRSGAVNTLVIGADGAIRGENTDGLGLTHDLEHNHGVTLAGKRVALLGAGGAARGVAIALLDAGVAELAVANRDPTRAAGFARDIAGARLVGYPALADGRFDLVVNATSARLHDALPPLPAGMLAPGGMAYDLSYSTAPTPFLRWAADSGAARAFDGWGMLVEQAAAAFALWTGRAPDTTASRDAR